MRGSLYTDQPDTTYGPNINVQQINCSIPVLWIPITLMHADPDADPDSDLTYHPDADPDSVFYLTRTRMQIRIPNTALYINKNRLMMYLVEHYTNKYAPKINCSTHQQV